MRVFGTRDDAAELAATLRWMIESQLDLLLLFRFTCFRSQQSVRLRRTFVTAVRTLHRRFFSLLCPPQAELGSLEVKRLLTRRTNEKQKILCHERLWVSSGASKAGEHPVHKVLFEKSVNPISLTARVLLTGVLDCICVADPIHVIPVVPKIL